MNKTELQKYIAEAYSTFLISRGRVHRMPLYTVMRTTASGLLL